MSSTEMADTSNTQFNAQNSTQTQAPDHNEPPEAEGGWGYVIVASVFVVNFAILGWFQSQTFFFVEWQREFSSSSVEASVLVSIGVLIFGIFSPLGSILAAWIGARGTVITGGLFVSIGMLGTMFMESILGIILTWGVITGFGFALIYSPSVPMIGQYFDQHFTLANGVAYTGAAIGQIFVPLLADVLIDAYGWRGAMLLLSGIMSHLIAAGAVLRFRVKQKRVQKDKKFGKSDAFHDNEAYKADSGSRLGASVSESQTDTLDGLSMEQDMYAIKESTESVSANSSSVIAPKSESNDVIINQQSDLKGTAIFISLVRNIGFDIILVVFIFWASFFSHQ
ncbi:monocarboxylate transporter 13-like [Amphiura filiformis]|uniref:monocarboxylate transporter 13-like n=1 Tax=Amphiura filiformis TaxID=82378 RepID=UPI003B20D8C8